MKRLVILFLVILPFFATRGQQAAGELRRLDAAPLDVQAWPNIALEQVVSGLTSPVHITHAGDGSGRLFVVERGGRIKIIQGGVVSGVFPGH